MVDRFRLSRRVGSYLRYQYKAVESGRPLTTRPTPPRWLWPPRQKPNSNARKVGPNFIGPLLDESFRQSTAHSALHLARQHIEHRMI